MPSPFPHRHLLGIEALSAGDIRFLLDEAEPWVEFNRGARRADPRLAGLTQFNLFFENSTRTLFSFEVAGKRLGAQVANFHPGGSSVRKGESLIDTASTLGAMRPDVMIVVGGVIPPGDFEALRQAGASAIFPPGTVIADAASGLLDELRTRLEH